MSKGKIKLETQSVRNHSNILMVTIMFFIFIAAIGIVVCIVLLSKNTY